MTSCGYMTGLITDPQRSNWDDTGPRPIAWSAWYPTEASAPASPPESSFFDPGQVGVDAPPTSAAALPVVLLSHGTGGTAESLGWLARALAGLGYVVLGANHHGNTGVEPYRPEGFLCWWERASDLSVLLDALASNGPFAGLLDMRRVSAVGFSLGGYTALALAGARTSLAAFEAWRAAQGVTAGGPREFPGAADHIDGLLQTSKVFSTSWARHGRVVSDARIRSLVAIAPAPTVRAFLPASVAGISIPVTILSGGADTEAPVEQCGDWLIQQNPRFTHHNLGRDIGHYTFVDLPADPGLSETVEVFADFEGVDRRQVHVQAAHLIRRALK